jgi:TonB family protein
MNGQMRRDYFCRSAALFLVFLSVLTRPLIGQQAPQPIEAAAAIYFDIPAQSLAGALDRYSAASGLMVMYDSGLAKDRRSTAVQGLLAPDVAISVLLEGTGLVAFNAGKTFGLEEAGLDQAGPPRSGDAADLAYLALVQRAVERSFCDRAQTRPGAYRAALQFRIGPSGDVSDARLLSSTGDQARDRVILEVLRGLRVSRVPPSRLAQPISMIISPRPLSVSRDCGSIEAPAGRP